MGCIQGHAPREAFGAAAQRPGLHLLGSHDFEQSGFPLHSVLNHHLLLVYLNDHWGCRSDQQVDHFIIHGQTHKHHWYFCNRNQFLEHYLLSNFFGQPTPAAGIMAVLCSLSSMQSLPSSFGSSCSPCQSFVRISTRDTN